MSDWSDDQEDDDEYFSEIIDGAELTGKEPRFIRLLDMDLDHHALGEHSVQELILKYRGLRDQLATDRKGYKERERLLKTQLQVMSMILRDRGDQAGVDSFATTAGTAYRNKKEKFQISDWDSFCRWLLQTGNVQVLQKRVAPNAVKEVRDDAGMPPGIACFSEVEFAVRSPTARKRN